MAAAVPFIMLAATAVSTGVGYMSYVDAQKARSEAGDKAQEIANANARRIEEEGKEEVRRQEEENRRLAGLAKAKAGASGVKLTEGGSMQAFIDAIKKTGMEEIDWLKKATASQADITRRGGAYESMTQKAASRKAGSAATLSLVRGAGDIGDWWNKYGSQVGDMFKKTTQSPVTYT